MLSNGFKVVVLFACVLLAGCATNRSEIKLNSPSVAVSNAAIVSGRTAVIRLVKDERVFEQAPSDPSTPSLGFEGAAQASADVKSRAIGRKRNGFGKAMGDILLQDGQTVDGVVRENLAAALNQSGYKVVSDAEIDSTTLVVNVHVNKFWTWLQPGFWAITLHAIIDTDLVQPGGAPTLGINVHATQTGQMATDGTWMEILNKALDEYRAQVVEKLGQLH